jgi:hypothetical protein
VAPLAEHGIDESVVSRPHGIEIKVGALGVSDDLAQRLPGSIGENAIDLALHLLQAVEMLRGGCCRLPAGPLCRLVDHDPGMRKGERRSGLAACNTTDPIEYAIP